jgi:hypothetical protein
MLRKERLQTVTLDDLSYISELYIALSTAARVGYSAQVRHHTINKNILSIWVVCRIRRDSWYTVPFCQSRGTSGIRAVLCRCFA